MLKTINTIFLFSCFSYSSVFSMRQIAQIELANIFAKTPIVQVAVAKVVMQRKSFHESLIARCCFFDLLMLQGTEDLVNTADQTSVAAQYEAINCSCTSNDNSIECLVGLHNCFNRDGRNEQEKSCLTNSNLRSEQPRLDLLSGYNLQSSSSTLLKYFSDFKSIVANRVSKCIDFNSLSSIQEISAQQAVLSQKLCMLEKPFLKFTQQNPKLSFIADATRHGFDGIPYHAKDRLTDTDYQQALVLLELKAEIEAIKVAIRECDWKMNGIKQKPVNFAHELKHASVDAIEKEIMPDLIAKKEKMDIFIDQQRADLRVKGNKIKDIEDQLDSFNKRSCIDRICHPFTSINLLNQLKIAQAEWVKTNQELECLYYDQAKYSLRIGQVLQVIDEKNQLALQEAQFLKENIEKNIVYDEALQSQHDACDFSHDRCFDRELQHQWSQRQNALSQAISQGYAQYEQEFFLDPQVAACLDVHGVDYKKMQSFVGTALQQQLHRQMCDVLSQAVVMQKLLPYQNGFLTNVVSFADAAYDANKNNKILLASRLLDVNCYLLQLNRQMLHAVHMCTSLRETIQNLGKALYYVFETIALNASEDVVRYPENYGSMRDKRNAEIVAALKHLGQQIEASTGPQRVEAVVRFGTNFHVSGKVIQALGGVFGAVQSRPTVLLALECVTAMLEEQGVAQAVLQAAEKVTVATQEDINKAFARELANAEIATI
ncbi:hypothetical protein KBD08_00415 [Candidatus Babeliales bacterium]|nr:hypothetical protein [Candidatus Babeliales bacterium]